MQPDLLDDFRDQWRAVHHETERIRLIQWLQKLALLKKMRVSVVAGDVHCAGAGIIEPAARLRSDPTAVQIAIESRKGLPFPAAPPPTAPTAGEELSGPAEPPPGRGAPIKASSVARDTPLNLPAIPPGGFSVPLPGHIPGVRGALPPPSPGARLLCLV